MTFLSIFYTDPMFSDRASPVQWMGPKRYRRPACTIDELPDQVNPSFSARRNYTFQKTTFVAFMLIVLQLSAVLISHTHYDHLDTNSVSALMKKYGNQIHWIVPHGLKSWLEASEHPQSLMGPIHEMQWWDEIVIESADSNEKLREKKHVAITFLPAIHWSQRTPSDRNKVLWGGWAVIGDSHRYE